MGSSRWIVVGATPLRQRGVHSHRLLSQTEEKGVIVRTIAITLAAVAAINEGSVSSTSAKGHGFGHSAFGYPAGARHFAVVRRFASRGHRFAFRHRFFRNRFVFVAAPFAYGNSYARVWTRWGGRWVPVCYWTGGHLDGRAVQYAT
jgi:hypothetical protein